MPAGRPSRYSEEFATQAGKLCEFGLTDEELAEFFKINVRTLYRWQAEHPEFCQALKSGKTHADERVERSLYHRAVGYKHDAVKIFMPAGAKEPVYAPYTEHVPPDTTAGIFWLKNRRPEEWRDKKDVDIKIGLADELTDNELADVIGRRRSTGVAETPPDTQKLN